MNCAAHSATSCVSKKPMTTERSPSVRATASPTDWSVCAGAPTLATRKSATAASVHARVYGTGSGSSRRKRRSAERSWRGPCAGTRKRLRSRGSRSASTRASVAAAPRSAASASAAGSVAFSAACASEPFQ